MSNSNLETIATQLVSINQLLNERLDDIQRSIDSNISETSNEDLENMKKAMDKLSKAFKHLKESRKRFKKLKTEYLEKAQGE